MPRIRWIIAALLFLSAVINYIDRQVLSVLAPVLTKEFNLSPTDYANIGLAFQIPYTLMYVGSGFLVDRWGARKALAVFMIWWSVASMLHSFARSAFSLGFFRVLLGIGEPGNFMAGFRAISDWYPAREKAFVNGLLNAGAAVGAIIAPPLVAFLGLHYGWRQAFVVTGLLGFIWLFFWLQYYRMPAPEEAPPPAAGSDGPLPTRLELLKRPETWALLLSRFISDPVWWFYLLWLPKYLADRRGFSLAEIGLVAWMPYLAADVGALAGGWLSGRLVRRGWPVLRARAMGTWPFALVMPLSLLIPTAPISQAIAIICAVAFAHMAWKTNMQTVTNDVFPARVVGTVSGMIAFGNGLGGALFTWLTGWVVQNISYDAIFVIMGFLHPVAYLIFRFIMGRRLDNACKE